MRLGGVQAKVDVFVLFPKLRHRQIDNLLARFGHV